MSRLSFRPRPVDIHKKLPIVKSVRDLDNEDGIGVSRMVQHGHVALDSENELVGDLGSSSVLATPARRGGAEIPTPQFVCVDTYEKDYSQTFTQPPSYLRSRGARNEGTEFVEYDLDDEDEDWLEQFSDRKTLSHEKFERILYKMELQDHKLRERVGGLPSTLGIPMPVMLQKDGALEVVRAQNIRSPTIAGAVYDYWKSKRERWEKPILRRLQPPPPVNDTNPFNVFRPREKIHRPHTRRMQRRENDVQSFDKLRQVRRNLEQARALMLAVQKREEKKRELADCEGHIQRLQIKYKHESKADEDTSFLNSASLFPPTVPRKLLFPKRSDDLQAGTDQMNGDAYEYANPMLENSLVDRMDPLRKKRKKRLPLSRGRPARKFPIRSIDTMEPVMLFTKPLEARELADAGILPPQFEEESYQFRGRMGRGGRIVFDRWNPLTRTSVGNNLPFCSLAN
ncbi:hypothetical protein SELMODRAFT_139753 [Selaginella moellendorffii]|uniref:Enhancer of polycomb-like protein n=1 Tax=Selaginella moellendorffii TaxID=88036 RepID=D8QMJ4_SELML|nr:hypothetical protein SELMODRAFT_139753 [Selaginella moellendorffii]